MDLPVSTIQFVEEDENGNAFYLKREDLLPFSFGGNKLRIALGYLEDFHRDGADRMIAYGNARSNLCRVLANLCAAWEIPLTIIRPADDDGERRVSFNEQISRSMGAEIVNCTKQNVAETVDAVLTLCDRRGEKPYYIHGNRLGIGREEIPPASIAPVFQEILTQEAEMKLHFDAIGVAAATGMTLAGLAAGASLHGDERPIYGLSVARDAARLRDSTLRYLHAWQESSGCHSSVPRIHYCDRYREVYGKATPETEMEIQRMMKRYGVPMDSTYTGKAWYAFRQEAKKLRGKKLLFLHTGGTPLYFDGLRVQE